MRSLIIGLFLALLACPASGGDLGAPAEAVIVESSSPVGLWKLRLPQSFDLHGVIGKADWGAQADQFCQIETTQEKLAVHCLGLRIGGRDVSRGRVSIKGRQIRMTWGSMWTNLTISGTMETATQFKGRISVSHLGISSEYPDEVDGTKLFLADTALATGSKSVLLARLLDRMARGEVTEAIPAASAIPDKGGPRVRFLKPDTLETLGARQSITYLGDGGTSPPLGFYDVEFANGHLICSLRQNGDGMLDQFDCG